MKTKTMELRTFLSEKIPFRISATYPGFHLNFRLEVEREGPVKGRARWRTKFLQVIRKKISFRIKIHLSLFTQPGPSPISFCVGPNGSAAFRVVTFKQHMCA